MQSINLEAEILDEVKSYLLWETKLDFSDWENIDFIFSDTLSEAWIKARPSDAYIFNDEEFKYYVDSAQGKWLEKQSETDTYKIIISLKHCSFNEICQTVIHEMRHCLDYQITVKDMPFSEYRPGNHCYNNWSEFRAVTAGVRYEFFANIYKNNKGDDTYYIFKVLSELLGYWSADSLEGLMRSSGNEKETLYFISRYIGASRAIRNLSMEYNIDSRALHLWNMTPTYITEKFGSNIFYVGNEWDETKIMDLDMTPGHRYIMLLERLKINNQDINGN